MKPLPNWDVPTNVAILAKADEGGIWESDCYSPITLSVMVGTVYDEREIPLAWQIEFDPTENDFQDANRKIESIGLEPDGYGWSTLINSIFEQHFPDYAAELQFGDTEESACVIWVESEELCKKLIEVIWSVAFENRP